MLRNCLKTCKLSGQIFFKTALAFIISVSLITSCGKRTPPAPPVEKVAQRAEISAAQRGNRIILSWNLPNRNASDSSVVNITRVDVYRLVEPLTSPQNITEEEFSSRSTLIGSVSVGADDISNRRLTYTDTIEFAGQAARLRYAVRFVNASGQKAGFSNFLLVEPTARVAAPPVLTAAEVSQENIRLKWTKPSGNVDGTQPANILGYNVYRFDAENPSGKILNSTPVTNEEFNDDFFEFEKKYEYMVRSVSLGANGQPIESENSNKLETTPKDTFPPASPQALTIAATPTSISLFFAASVEKDIAGYRVYRSTDPNLAKNAWQNLTPELLQTNTLQDAQVESGRTYFYFVTAVDKFGNVSEPSGVVSETVP
jgi:fibronectin type 3 domain-containing protein